MRSTMLSVGALVVARLLVGNAAADQIENIINQASVAEFQSYERVLTGIEPVPEDPSIYLTNRYALGPQAPWAAQWISDQMASSGLNVTQEYFHNFYAPNVIGELPGTTRPDDIYIISGHYDTWHLADQTIAPGCDDNGSGTSAVLMAARILAQYQFQGTLRFVAFSGEEEGMVGSSAYVGSHYGENIVATINLDMFLHPGWDNVNPDPDYDLDIGVNGPSGWLGQYVLNMFGQYTPIAVKTWNDTYGNSDHGPFWDYGYSAIRLSEHTTPENWYENTNDSYHQVTDTMDNPDYDWQFGTHAVRGTMASLIGLAGLVPEPSTGLCLGLLGVVATLRRRAR